MPKQFDYVTVGSSKTWANTIAATLELTDLNFCTFSLNNFNEAFLSWKLKAVYGLKFIDIEERKIIVLNIRYPYASPILLYILQQTSD